jgi:hypothetical protein
MAKFLYLSPEEYDSLDDDQKSEYINAALDHRASQSPHARPRGEEPHAPDVNAAAAAGTQQQQPQQQQQDAPPAQDAESPAPAKDDPA